MGVRILFCETSLATGNTPISIEDPAQVDEVLANDIISAAGNLLYTDSHL